MTTYREQAFLRRLDKDFTGENGAVYKTHDPNPPRALNRYVKVAFVFGNPFDGVISIYNNLRSQKAYRNALSKEYFNHEKIFVQDVMRLEENFCNWYKMQGFPFVSVKYESLYENETLSILEDFFETKLILPKKRRRQSQWSTHERREDIEFTYGRLAEKIESAEQVKVWETDSVFKED